MRPSFAAFAVCLSLSCVPSRPELKASLQGEAGRIEARDRAVLKEILEAAKIDEQEVDVRHVSSPYPLTAMDAIDAPMAIWIAKGRIVGIYLLGVDRAQRCVFETFCRLTGWLRGRSAPHFPGFALLARLPELRTLHLHALPIGQLEGIGKLRGLRQLVANGCGLRSLAGLRHLRRLRLLDLSGNELGAVGDLAALTELGILRLGDNRITALPALGTLRRLHRLEIHDNPFGHLDLRALSRIGHLAATTRELDLSRVGLRSLGGVSAFSRLRRLTLIGNRLERLDGLEGLQELEELDVQYNRLQRLDAPSGLPRLRSLNAAGNRISRVDARGLVALETLSLWKNRIARFADIALPARLQRLDLSDNPIASADGLEQLFVPLKKLESIQLHGTPVAKVEAARLEALGARHRGRIFIRIE